MTEEALARAEAQVEAGDLDGARATAEAILADEPTHAGARNVLGFIAHRQGRLADALVEFTLAGDDPDALANIAAVEAELKRVSAPPPSPTFSCSLRRAAPGRHRARACRRCSSGSCSRPSSGGELEQRINQLPSAASANERRFLMRFAATFWDGDGDVFENGPLLGRHDPRPRARHARQPAAARRRAVAHVRLVRRRRGRPAARLGADDRREDDHPRRLQGRCSARGASRRSSTSSTRATTTRRSCARTRPICRGTPATRRPTAGCSSSRRGGGSTSCSSTAARAGTGPSTGRCACATTCAPGSHFVFQDYGWYTCFWLPVFHAVLEEHFRLVAHVDDTYAFQLVHPLDRETIEERFPDEPTDLRSRRLRRDLPASSAWTPACAATCTRWSR